MIKKIQIIIIGIIFCFLFACNNGHGITKAEKLTRTDSIWVNFARAMENNDMDYLLSNSLDSIKCTECDMNRGLGYQREDHIYESGVVFRQRMSEIMHIDSLSEKEFLTAQQGDLIYVSYKVRSKKIMEPDYNLIFIFKKTLNGYKFTGMTMI